MDEPLWFWLFGAVTLAGSANVVLRRHAVHAALFLVGTFLGVAGLYLTAGAALLAAIQVMVYAGAIMVLFLFVILLLNLEADEAEGVSVARGASALAAFATCLLLLLPFLRADPPAPAPTAAVPADVPNVALALFVDQALPFELVSLLLLVAMVGAIHLARRPDAGEAR